jgi:hypothetical protein
MLSMNEHHRHVFLAVGCQVLVQGLFCCQALTPILRWRAAPGKDGCGFAMMQCSRFRSQGNPRRRLLLQELGGASQQDCNWSRKQRGKPSPGLRFPGRALLNEWAPALCTAPSSNGEILTRCTWTVCWRILRSRRRALC